MSSVNSFLLLFFLPFSLLAQPKGYKNYPDIQGLSRKIAEKAHTVKSIDSDFIQEKNLSVLTEKIVATGHFSFKKENRLRWEYKEPFRYLVILNNGKVYVKDENKENKFDMQSNKLFREINNLIVNSVQGKLNDTKNFNLKAFESTKNYLIEMTPRSKNLKEFVQTMEVTFDKSDYSVTSINMIESSGDNTCISFVSRKFNSNISDDTFSFQ